MYPVLFNILGRVAIGTIYRWHKEIKGNNNYENLSNITWIKKRIYPFEFDSNSKNSYTEDYVSETDIKDLVIDMICTYVDYELRITVKNSFASENVMRQNSTNESLKKIDEIENK